MALYSEQYFEWLVLWELSMNWKDEGSYHAAMDRIVDGDFYNQQAKKLWKEIKKFYEKNKYIDKGSMVSTSVKKDIMVDLLDAEKVYGLSDTFLHITHSVKKLQECTARRELSRTLTSVSRRINAGEELESIREEINTCFGVIANTQHTEHAKEAQKILSDSFDQWSQYADSTPEEKMRLRGLQTGYAQIDNVIRGIKSEYVLIAAPPSVGKTTFSLNLVYNFIKNKKRVFFVSLEMSSEQLIEKLFSVHMRKSLQTSLDAGEMQEIATASDGMRELLQYLHITDYGSLTATRVVREIQKLQAHQGVDAVFVDYIGLLSPEDQRAGRVQQVSEMSRILASASKQLKVPIFALSQLSRDSQKAQGNKINNRAPILADLRDSGSLEQDADKVFMLHNPHYQEADKSPERHIDIYLRKNRLGAIGDFAFTFYPSQSLFVPDTLDGSVFNVEF